MIVHGFMSFGYDPQWPKDHSLGPQQLPCRWPSLLAFHKHLGRIQQPNSPTSLQSQGKGEKQETSEHPKVTPSLFTQTWTSLLKRVSPERMLVPITKDTQAGSLGAAWQSNHMNEAHGKDKAIPVEPQKIFPINSGLGCFCVLVLYCNVASISWNKSSPPKK